MSTLNREIETVQNPAIGAVALWRFTSSYYSVKSSPIPFPLLFIILPIVFRSDLRKVIVHTYKNSGLAKFTEKLGKEKSIDHLYAIHYSTDQYKYLSLQSLHIAEASQLVFVEIQTGYVYPLLQSIKIMDNADVQEIADAADRLGFWCSNLTMHEISILLKVRF